MVNFVDVEALTSELRDRRVLKPGEVGALHQDTIKAEFVIFEATGTWDCRNAPGEVKLGGSPWGYSCER